MKIGFFYNYYNTKLREENNKGGIYMGLIEGKVAIVTGGGQGLGEGICKNFAKQGASVAIFGRTFSKVERVANEIKEAGGNAIPILCDISNRESVNEAVKMVVDTYGKIDILVNNAMVQRLVPFDQSTAEDLMAAYESSVLGTYNMMMACFPYLKETKGKVVNMGSAAGTEGRPNQITYAASKEAVRGLTKGFAVEWGVYGINVNVVCPTGSSPAWEAYAAQIGEEGVQKTLSQFLIKRMGDPETDIANVVLFASSYLSDYMTGRTLFADGGRACFR